MSTNNATVQQSVTLPTFTSIHDQPEASYSYAESSNASSSRSRSAVHRSKPRSDNGLHTKEREKDVPTLTVDHVPAQENRLGLVTGSLRRSKRASGGFLLDPSPLPPRSSRLSILPKNIKGKHKPDETLQLSSSVKKRPQLDGQDSASSLRASPLSSDVRLSSPPPPPNTDVQTNPRQPVTSSMRSYGSQSSRQPPSYGFDTDPIQIVDMALRLNEARRRQASAKRHVSTSSEGRRVISVATTLPPRSSPPTALDQPNGIGVSPPKRISLNPQPITPRKRARGATGETIKASPMSLGAFSPENTVDEVDHGVQISRATQNRVAKAKEYFELAYEHRRLLSHLPPIRRPDVPISADSPAFYSKAYNPLQYARNRKLRFRERAAINSQAEGWHDTLKVRAWVDAVVNSHTETRHNPLECVRLPPLSLLEEDLHDSAESGDSTKAPRPDKPRRPKSDWVTHPGDLIADAFWTEQGLNKQKIHDRDNDPIYPPGTKFHFSGWRNRTPIKVPEELKFSSSPEVSPTTERRDLVPALPDLPIFESAHKDNSWARTRSKFKNTLKKSSRRTDTDRNHDIFDTSSESDTSDSTRRSKEQRGRQRRAHHTRDKMQLPDGDPFALRARSPEKTENKEANGNDSSRQPSRRGSIDHINLLKHLRRSSTTGSASQGDADKQKSSIRRQFLTSLKLDSEQDRGRESFEYDSTAPGTPLGYGFPSIAINLSPPESRSPSPTRKQKTSLLGAVKDKIHAQKDRIDRTDFAKEHSSSQDSRDRRGHSQPHSMSWDDSRGTSPMSRGLSPFAKVQIQPPVEETFFPHSEPRLSAISKTSTRTTESATQRSHRVRGMFKGGRIAEIVGNEVSRVGDFIWKREPPRRNDIIDDGSSSSYDSDSEEIPDSKERLLKLANNERRSPVQNHTNIKITASASGVEKSPTQRSPQYHIQGLPSFTSPFQRDREEQEKKRSSQSPDGILLDAGADGYDTDPVSTGAAARRTAGRSPRLDRLQPSKLDIKAATPDGRQNSYGFGQALDLSRTRSASQLYNSAINDEPSESTRQRSSAALNRPDFFSSKALSRTTPNSAQTVTINDYFRTRALLIATAIKATNIGSYCESIPDPQSPFLFSAFNTTGASGSEITKHLPALRKDEHVIAARHLVAHLANESSMFSDRLTNFTHSTTVTLHRRIQTLEDNADASLFPRLQALSDQAGQLAQKLTTTSTLAVRSVNDEVTEAMRMRRRGPRRLGRWLGYKLIEWGVVSVLWGIWFVVTVVRTVVGIVSGTWAVFAWLFFLR